MSVADLLVAVRAAGVQLSKSLAFEIRAANCRSAASASSTPEDSVTAAVTMVRVEAALADVRATVTAGRRRPLAVVPGGGVVRRDASREICQLRFSKDSVLLPCVHHGRLTAPVARGLDVLTKRIAKAKVPPTKLDETLTIATWSPSSQARRPKGGVLGIGPAAGRRPVGRNIREFGRRRRLDASLHYIAEVIGQFDIVSVVELRDDVGEMETVLRYLGPYWRVVYSDYIADAGGNRERIGYVYDTRAAVFTGLASHAAVPRKKSATGEWVSEIGWWRPPYMASFSSGGFELVILSAHVRWGDGGEKGRVGEIEMVADWVADRAAAKAFGARELLLVGDFNIPSLKGPMYRAVTARGLRMPAALAGVQGSNLAKDKRYDQILHLPSFSRAFTGKGGVVDFFMGDFRPLYAGVAGARGKSGVDWTYEMSDHLPLWVQVATDDDVERRGRRGA